MRQRQSCHDHGKPADQGYRRGTKQAGGPSAEYVAERKERVEQIQQDNTALVMAAGEEWYCYSIVAMMARLPWTLGAPEI